MCKRFAVLVCVLAIIAGCAPFGGRTGTLTLQVTDGMMNRSVVPGMSLEADHYAIHGVGTSGQADEASFDLEIPAGQATADVELLPGDWTITATVWNDDTPAVAVGSATAAATIVIGNPATVILHVTPYTGPGTLDIALSWVPDILAVPGVEAELVALGGASTPVPMVPESSTASNGTLSIEQGWYTGAVRIYDGGELNAGIVRAVRIASGATTTWTEFLTVNQLEGGVTLDMSWYPGDPLTLTTNPAEGAVDLYNGHSANLQITAIDNDAGSTVIYAWYLNGVLTALGTGSSFTADSEDLGGVGQYYISCIVFQSDGKRAGDAQWTINRIDLDPDTLNVHVTVTTLLGGRHYIAQICHSVTKDELWWRAADLAVTGPLSFEFLNVPVGSYYLRVFADLNYDGTPGVWNEAEPKRWWQLVADSAGLAALPAFPANVIVPNDGSVVYTLPDIQ